MKKLDERRAAFRMDVVSRAICRLKSETVMTSGPIRDISIAGLYLETTAKPAVQTRSCTGELAAGQIARSVPEWLAWTTAATSTLPVLA